MKPQNILVTDAYHVQITDFGEARTVDHENTMTQVGTQLFVAPEVVRGWEGDDKERELRVDMGCAILANKNTKRTKTKKTVRVRNEAQ